ncbi:GNAT family N-acetyltransferase [Erwinia psidii]|uniref:GNAT family N-acetyltransferase n=1 Tax=Erwinia psidii TaxID=69224 RepID=A0A3N6SDR6_9GAMM|nr:GNAT family N-acetyltransferase [Erwinia psidii]MCX8957593.1 GNAT family N-acetyltransferase [Erwinia psidii]MCX8960647.1 GNAT family N-acetyltransferase [Erwinia psidii]MCX8964108.1 GNAT family N-acetyltransferase [Erwinia psidii]RQM39590.1 GNAT family N-acetyltransferase [Erwinia psidii]
MNMIMTATPNPDDVNHIRQKMMAFNAQHVDVGEIKDMAVFIDDNDGNKIAGLLGVTWGNWMHIHFLWVDEALRGNGHGARLLQAAEQEAIVRGCQRVCVDTFSFQARDFYEKQGYRLQMTLEQMPQHHRQHYLVKQLAPATHLFS